MPKPKRKKPKVVKSLQQQLYGLCKSSRTDDLRALLETASQKASDVAVAAVKEITTPDSAPAPDHDKANDQDHDDTLDIHALDCSGGSTRQTYGFSALHIACYSKKWPMAQILLQHGQANPFQYDVQSKTTPLHLMLRGRDMWSSPSPAWEQTDKLLTALCIQALDSYEKYDKKDAMKRSSQGGLIDGDDSEILWLRDEKGASAFELAGRFAVVDVVAWYLQRYTAAELSRRVPPTTGGISSILSCAVVGAARLNHPDSQKVQRLLLDHATKGENPQAASTVITPTCWEEAIDKGYWKTDAPNALKVLLEYWETPKTIPILCLHRAVSKYKPLVVQALVDYFVSHDLYMIAMTTHDELGDTPLHCCTKPVGQNSVTGAAVVEFVYTEQEYHIETLKALLQPVLDGTHQEHNSSTGQDQQESDNMLSQFIDLRSVEEQQVGLQISVLFRVQQTPLHAACQYGLYQVARLLLTRFSANPNISAIVPDSNGNDQRTGLPSRTKQRAYPLHTVCEQSRSSLEMIQALVDAGADVSVVDPSSGFTPLDFLVRGWNAEEKVLGAIPLLLTAGASLMPSSPEVDTPLIVSVRKESLPLMKLILETAEGKDMLDTPDRKGNTPLLVLVNKSNDNPSRQQAVKEKRREILTYLLETGADATLCNARGQTPAERAIELGDAEVSDVLLRKAELQSQSKQSSGVVEETKRDDTVSSQALASDALLNSCRQGRISMVRTLLKNGYSIDVTDKETGWSPLHIASRLGNEALVEILLKADASVEALDAKGKTPLTLAHSRGHVSVMKLLLKKGARVESDVIQKMKSIDCKLVHLALSAWNSPQRRLTAFLQTPLSARRDKEIMLPILDEYPELYARCPKSILEDHDCAIVALSQAPGSFFDRFQSDTNFRTAQEPFLKDLETKLRDHGDGPNIDEPDVPACREFVRQVLEQDEVAAPEHKEEHLDWRDHRVLSRDTRKDEKDESFRS